MSTTSTRTGTQQTPRDVRKQFEDLPHDKALSRMTVSPVEMIEESRNALDSIRDFASNASLQPDEVCNIIEPLARCVGWSEALVYAFDKYSQRDAVTSLFSQNGPNR